MTFRELIEKVSIWTQLAIQNKMRSDVFCKNVKAAIALYERDYNLRQNRTLFGGNNPEDHEKLAQADDGLSDEDYRRLRDADDEGRDELDDDDGGDNDAF